MKQPKMKILSTNEIFPVASIVWLDNGTTCRAYPLDVWSQPTNYVIVKGEGETTEVGAELIFED